jgi:hypothetical protein
MLAIASATRLATALEADRLRHRAQRMELVVARLRERVEDRRRRGEPVPMPLGQAIDDFETELRAVRRRLAALHGPR